MPTFLAEVGFATLAFLAMGFLALVASFGFVTCGAKHACQSRVA